MLSRSDASDIPAVVHVYRLLKDYWALTILLTLVLRFTYYKYASPLRHYPGPLLASGSRAWKVWSTWSGHTENDHIAVHKRYGPVVRIAPNELSFASPKAAKEVLAAGKGFHKTDFYGVFPPPENPDIFTETREEVHSVKKRYASNPYSMATMHTMTHYIEDTERLLTKKLDSMCQRDDQYCNLGDNLHFFAFDVLGEIAFSRKFGFLEAGYDLEAAIKTIDDMQWYDGIIGQIPEWDFVFRRNPLWKYVPSMSTSNFLITRMAVEEIEKRNALGNKEIERKDLLSQLFAAHEKAPEVFKQGDVFAVAHGAIFAGSDSTASTMQSFSYHVLRDQEIYAKLKKELDSATVSGNLSEMPQWSEAQALPFFQACLKEAMRLRPAVGLNICRKVPLEGAEIDGYKLPGGTRVALNGWVLHRDQEIFGRDADVYRPERWLDGDAKMMERYMFQFGGGAHLCIGKNLALLEMNKTLPLLFRDYNFQLLRPDEELKYHSTFFVVQEGLEVRISRRGKAT
ncbi:Putative cytochrome P450 [Septoria linicola]|uniref:Cytochrome P450 n=1 Tax=Septoria linicola TaxID=215465 RepID=A0A9Q9EEF8_9PEZI|nr:Putative cytochrome P450 [Septoria linicola]